MFNRVAELEAQNLSLRRKLRTARRPVAVAAVAVVDTPPGAGAGAGASSVASRPGAGVEDADGGHPAPLPVPRSSVPRLRTSVAGGEEGHPQADVGEYTSDDGSDGSEDDGSDGSGEYEDSFCDPEEAEGSEGASGEQEEGGEGSDEHTTHPGLGASGTSSGSRGIATEDGDYDYDGDLRGASAGTAMRYDHSGRGYSAGDLF